MKSTAKGGHTRESGLVHGLELARNIADLLGFTVFLALLFLIRS